ncbi:MAG: NADH-quinone oxidoreductase subunit C [Planctomycetota bacterium]|jgi:NADH-quinone oxidoreductase subunit C
MSSDPDKVIEKFGAEAARRDDYRGQACVVVDPGKITEVLRFLKEDPEMGYNMMVDVTSVDYSAYPKEMEGRFAVVYHLWSIERKRRIRVKSFLRDEFPRMDTAADLYDTANWGEREVYDLMGIGFDGHPDLRRIMLPETFEGHPLRKEYPLEGRGERHDFEKYDPDSEI